MNRQLSCMVKLKSKRDTNIRKNHIIANISTHFY